MRNKVLTDKLSFYRSLTKESSIKERVKEEGNGRVRITIGWYFSREEWRSKERGEKRIAIDKCHNNWC